MFVIAPGPQVSFGLVHAHRLASYRPLLQPIYTPCRVSAARKSTGMASASANDPPTEQPNETMPRLSTWQRLGQSFNAAGIAFFARVALSDRSLALPHLDVADLRHIEWAKLKNAGFEGCIFDKDNTLTEPYVLQLHPTALEALTECRAAFGGNIALYSNSAGLEQFDPDGIEATALETALGVPVLRHREKKPAGGPEDIEKHFGCDIHKVIMIGDRYLTDIAFGNRLGMLTIRPVPFTSVGETKAVRAARVVEEAFVGRCKSAGVLPPQHPLVDDLKSIVKNVD